MVCFLCAHSSIEMKDGKVVGIDYDHCKGYESAWIPAPLTFMTLLRMSKEENNGYSRKIKR